MIAIDSDSPIPLHIQVQSLIRSMLEQAPYRDGCRLPDEISLAAQLRVCRGTVRQAIGVLVAEGLLVRRRGEGTRRCKTPIRGNMAKFLSFSREMSNAGIAVRLIAANFRHEAADAATADALGVALGLPVIRIERIRGDDTGPIAAFTSWMHPRCGVNADDDLSRPLYDIVAAHDGPRPARASEDLSAASADAACADALRCPEGHPLLIRRRRVFDAAGACFECAVVRYRGDRFNLHLDLAAGEG